MKYLRILLSLTLILLPFPAPAATECIPGTLVAMGDEQITVSTTAIGFTAAEISTSTAKAVYAYVAVQTNAVRYLDTGNNPTAGVGIPAAAGAFIGVCGVTNVANFKAIRSGGADATLDVIYYRAE